MKIAILINFIENKQVFVMQLMRPPSLLGCAVGQGRRGTRCYDAARVLAVTLGRAHAIA